MAEKLDFSTPELDAPGTLSWTPFLLHLNFENATIKVAFRGDNGEYTSIGYTGTEATTLMLSLNKSNLSTKSLLKRIMERVVADGKLTGIISGTPD